MVLSYDKELYQKGLIMTKKNPDDSVRLEQSGTPQDVAGTEDATQERNEPEAEVQPASEVSAEETDPENVSKTEKTKKRKRSTVVAEDDSSAVDTEIDSVDAELPKVDYSGYSKHDLVETLFLLIENRPPSEIRDDVERLKVLFYKKMKLEADERKSKFLEGGGKIEDYRPWVDPDDARVKHLLEKYREKKTDYSKIQEAEKYENLKKKYDIIDKIKDLVNREESINKTFHDFRTLQNEWHSVGVVPQASLKDIWENYHHTVELFYDYIKINKELRDLDLKKNLESKLVLCEKAEALMLEPNAVNAFRDLQDFHNQWREIGPVPLDSKNEIWERFKEATAQINKRHHEYFEKQKDEQKKNLDAKIALCEEVEAIIQTELKNFRDFDEKAERVVEFQKIWRTIGFAPKKQNNKVYQRFRDACDAFFEKKRSFYADNKEIQLNNLQKKIDLCVQAEAVQESTDWKSTSDILIRLQREWKDIGPVPRKQSERCWKRFRKACDHFFNRKTQFFSELDNSYEDNLKAKIEIIEELEKFDPGTDVQVAFDRLKESQRRWTEIGFVPFEKKDEIANRYRNAINNQFDKLKIADEDKSILKYKTKLDSLKTNQKASRKVRNERDKFFTKIKQLESDIVLWENNIGFFAKSANADTMIREVEEKIESARKLIKTLEEKVRMIDQSGLDD
jgi:putative ubiquitin-RnfH superfamily antitoxin RatB of RatAB toxin-antitoxin module